MSIWGIITARSGSVRLPNKNKLKLINKPLIEWSYVATNNSLFDKTILSTDCEECINISKKYKHIECPFIRPEELCTSDAKHIDVIKHCLNHYKDKNIKLPEYIAIIQPTTPERTTEHINYLIDYIRKHKELNGLSTYSMYNNKVNKTYELENNEIRNININNNNSTVYENGLLYIIKTDLIMNNKEIKYHIGSCPYDNIKPLIYPIEDNIIDIDTTNDFKYVEYKIKSKIDKIERNTLNIGGRILNNNTKPLVITEIGINHEGDMKKAIKMIYDAYYNGAECVKFQCHIPGAEMTNDAKKIVPSNANTDIYNIIERCSFNEEQERELKNIVEELGMIYLCTPFSIEAADRLESMNIKAYKIGSGEMNNLQLIEHVAKFGKPMLVSTGMNTLKRIRDTVNIIEKYKTPYCLFHCVSIYPTPYDKVNLPGVEDLKYEFPNAIIGLSDHSIGITSCFGAFMKGCRIFEKHYTSYKNWPGPDMEISITPKELKTLIEQLDILSDCCKGEGRYAVQKEEQGTIDFAYCTLTTTKDLKAGHILKESDIIAKRPNIGDYLAEDIPKLIGKTIKNDIKIDEKIFSSNIN